MRPGPVALVGLSVLGCVPLRQANLPVQSQLGKVEAEAEREAAGGWSIRMKLPNPAGSVQWNVHPRDASEVELRATKDATVAQWRITRERWREPKPFKVEIRNQNGLDLTVALGHPTVENAPHSAVIVLLQILGSVPWR